MSLNNLPPFYIGQKVVYITGHNMPKDSIHIVYDYYQSECGCWSIAIDNKPFEIKETLRRCICCNDIRNGKAFINNTGWIYTSFRALKEQSFPLLTYSKVLEEVGVSAN